MLYNSGMVSIKCTFKYTVEHPLRQCKTMICSARPPISQIQWFTTVSVSYTQVMYFPWSFLWGSTLSSSEGLTYMYTHTLSIQNPTPKSPPLTTPSSRLLASYLYSRWCDHWRSETEQVFMQHHTCGWQEVVAVIMNARAFTANYHPAYTALCCGLSASFSCCVSPIK